MLLSQTRGRLRSNKVVASSMMLAYVTTSGRLSHCCTAQFQCRVVAKTLSWRCVSMMLHVNAAGYMCRDNCLFSNATMDSTTIHRFSPLPTPAPRSGSDIIRDVSIVVATLMGALMCYRMYLDRKVRPTVAAPVHA